jgi:photosystem II stability/assembly factor-like uncharacterized protein
MKVVSVGKGGIWTSADGGASWTNQTPSGELSTQHWTSVASDSTGMKLVAVANGFVDRTGIPEQLGDIWTSTDGGATWLDRTASSDAHGAAWSAVASDATGTKLVAATPSLGMFGSGSLWTSTDGGATWIDRTVPAMAKQAFKSLASDATGRKLVAAANGQDIWTSVDSGATWTDVTPTGPAHDLGWSSVASDSTGAHLVAVANAGDIWTSNDGGASWTDRGNSQVWFSVASDTTGLNLVAVDALVRGGQDGDIWTSKDGGATWSNLSTTLSSTFAAAPSHPWVAVASNLSGSHLVVVGNGAVWTN